jgi:beta-lactamase class A
MNKTKLVIIIETILIFVLILLIIRMNVKPNTNYLDENGNVKLLSPRVYTNILAPGSFLIYNFEPLKKDIQEEINKKDLNVSVYILNLRDGASFGINEEEAFDAASLNKLPVAIIILKKVEEGKLNLDQLLPISYEDRDSSSGTLYSKPISELSVRELLRYLLQESDNTAFWVLAKQITFEEGEQLTSYLNYYKSEIDYSGPQKNLEITVKSTSNLFSSLYLSTILNAQHSEMILSWLTNTSFDIKKYANLPNDVVVAQKYASFYYQNNTLFSDCGIIYLQDSRLFYCIKSQGLNKEDSSKLIGDFVNKTYSYVINARNMNYIL